MYYITLYASCIALKIICKMSTCFYLKVVQWLFGLDEISEILIFVQSSMVQKIDMPLNKLL